MNTSWGFFMKKFLVAGLGNIGDEYTHTRHNIGFDILDHFVAKHNAFFMSDRLADKAEVSLKGKKIICIKPTTYMNLSGKSIKYWMDKEKIEPENLLVLVDELAVPLNKIKMKPSGSDGGHNGLKSIQEVLGTEYYPRLRFGIGNQFPKGKQVEFVLGKWSNGEVEIVTKKIARASQAIEDFILVGIDKAMESVNKFEV